MSVLGDSMLIESRRPSRKVPPREPAVSSPVGLAVERSRRCLLSLQRSDGHWCAELQGDTILEAEYILLMAFLGRENEDKVRKAANYILDQRRPDGAWSSYPGGPVDVSVSVKAYFALKLAGHAIDAPHMVRARELIRAAGGAIQCNSFTKFYLAFLGQLPYDNVPSVPAELMFLPRWAYVNLYAMSSWTRTIVVPLSIFSAYKPMRQVPAERGIGELFVENQYKKLPPCPPTQRLFTASNMFLGIDYLIKFAEKWGPQWVRKKAVEKAARWMTDHFEESDGVGAIFPPIIYTIISLHCLGYPNDSKEMVWALKQLDDLIIEEGNTVRLQPCFSPVWDTALALNALAAAGTKGCESAVARAARWLLAREVRRKGDWSLMNPGLEPGGWFFEYHNAFYPDTDDTAMVLSALARTGLAWEQTPALDGALRSADRNGSARNGRHDHNGHAANGHAANGHAANGHAANGHAATNGHAALNGRAVKNGHASRNGQVSSARGVKLAAVQRGIAWLLAMQNSDGGWAAFDRDINRDLLTKVPFADHNAMLDPSCPDITARVLEALAEYGFRVGHPQVDRAVAFIASHQDPRGCWIGRWGVNYIYGAWQVLLGLGAIGFDMGDPMVRRAVSWLKSVQQPSGAWGESCRSYDDPSQAGIGNPTASQTGWALLGLMAAGEFDSPSVRRGIDYLVRTQGQDGNWEENEFTGTGFPKVFYLKYHYYRLYFPLMALSRYAIWKKQGAIGYVWDGN